MHQINYVLAQTRIGGADNAEAVKRKILGTLIDQQLARQQALHRKLDRSPAVLMAIETARTQILARAYLEQIAAAQLEPTLDEIRSYYTEHPELFARRRIFNLEEITLVPGTDLAAHLRRHAQDGRSLEEIGTWLKTQDVKFNLSRGVRAAEQLPLEWLGKLQAMKDGDIRLLEAPQRLHLVRVVTSRPAPVDEAAAAPRIRRFLRNRRSTEAIARDMKGLRESATIVYVGGYSREASATPTQPDATLPASPPSAADSLEGPAAQPPAQSLEKGIRGLL